MKFPERERTLYSVWLKTIVLSMVGTKDGADANAERMEVELAARMHANVPEALEVMVPQPTWLVILYHIAALVVSLRGGITCVVPDSRIMPFTMGSLGQA